MGKVNFKLWWFKAEVLRYLGTIQASVTVCEECARFVYAWKVLKVEFLVFFFEVHEGKQSDNFSKTPLHSLPHTTHGFVES